MPRRSVRPWWVASALAVTVTLPGRVARATQPDSARQATALLSDVERIVETEESFGWLLDDDELADLKPKVMQSLCPTMPEARTIALARLRQKSEEAGDPRALYAADRELSPRVDTALSLWRQRRALELALEDAAACPFWLPVDPTFDGRQTDRDRLTLNVEFGGIVQLRYTDGSSTFGGGGLLRVLPAYGFGGVVTLLAGGEFGGSALIRPGAGPTTLVVNYFPALPVVLRVHDKGWHYDFETALSTLFQEDDLSLSYGGRAGFSVGFEALNTNGVIPWAGVAVAYEYYVDSGGRPAAHFARGGFRAGLSWDP